LVLLAILIVIFAAFFLVYKAGQARLKAMRPSGQAQAVTTVAQNGVPLAQANSRPGLRA
jgi:hypothetical protein